MRELHMGRSGNDLEVTLGEEQTFTVPFSGLVPDLAMWTHLAQDAEAYGRRLFTNTFPDEQTRTLLTNLPANERLVLVANDPLVASIPWEYLRDENDKLLAARLNFVRGLPLARRTNFAFRASLEILAIPSSPVDTTPLNVEGEWNNLMQAVRSASPARELTLKRVRPPTRSALEEAIAPHATSIVHFMGHSTSYAGKALLEFEDSRARPHLVDAADFADSLDNAPVLLVVLNSCLSAVVAHTEFGNIAQALVGRGIGYALGMQFALPDDAALLLSQAFYRNLLQGFSIEDAVTHLRRSLAASSPLSRASWLAGIPVLYTSLHAPAPALALAPGTPRIQPDPASLERTCDLSALAQATHFVGRDREISQVLDALLAPGARGFVVLHGMGGIGKTSLAHAVAERAGWNYDDRVLAWSFETFTRVEADGRRLLNEAFAERFYSRLAGFYELDPKQYATIVDLQQAILQRRLHRRSLLVFDNIETLLDITNQPGARGLMTFLSRLAEGEGIVLLTSRMMPPASWKIAAVIEVAGLEEQAGADLFLDLLPPERKPLAARSDRLQLSQRVRGHPFSIRLLAGRFSEAPSDLATFMTNTEGELAIAEQETPPSLEDPDRQRTLYACMDYSVKRLSREQRAVLDAISIFQAPFLQEFAAYLLNTKEQNAQERTLRHLQTLVRLSLLNREMKTFQDGELFLFDLHPMMHWYIRQEPREHAAVLLERYGEIYDAFVRQAHEEYDRSPFIRYVLRQSLVDCDVALQYLPPAEESLVAYHLADLYQRLGQNRRSLALYEQSLAKAQGLGDIRGVAMTRHTMADVLSQQGNPQEAMAFYEQALRTKQELGDIRGVAMAQHAMANVLSQRGKPQEAMALYEQVMGVYQELGDIRSVAVTQNAMADVLSQQGKPQEAMALYEQALRTKQELGDIREVAVTQANFSQLLLQQGEQQRSLLMAWQAYSSLCHSGYMYDAQVIQQVLIWFKGEMFGPAQFDAVWREAIGVAQPEWLRPVEAATSLDQADISGEQLEVMQAVRDFVNAEDWKAAQRIVAARNDVLFLPEVETIFEQNIVRARSAGEERTVTVLEMHLALLRACKKEGIQRAFDCLLANQEGALPFDRELISSSIAALLGSPQERLEYMQSLTEQENKAQDEDLKALIRVIQLALFSQEDLSQLGRDLQGVYRQAWETIVVAVETGGMDARVFEAIASNTLAVLGPAANQRSEWRTNLAELLNGATAQGQRNLAALVDAVIRLLDAGGNPAGLGGGLKGIYVKTWQSIVDGLPK